LLGITIGSGAGADWISWKFGKWRSPGAFGSPVQQQETEMSANAVATNAVRIRIIMMELDVTNGLRGFLVEKTGASYFEGLTYEGLLGAGAGLGQQEAAMTAAMPAMKASFMSSR
jgi:hypothetical protein